MTTSQIPFLTPEPSRDAVDASSGAVLLEFGINECPHCQRVQPLIADALRRHPEVQHWRIEDGKGRRLGRTFSVKLWPALIFLKNGQEVARVLRPTTQHEVDEGFVAL
ncbi:MAG: thioredoxin family protein [Rhodocyclaceae bacterium]|nr:thioredoxin family protein [Rhodocyclaceae bacterium]